MDQRRIFTSKIVQISGGASRLEILPKASNNSPSSEVDAETITLHFSFEDHSTELLLFDDRIIYPESSKDGTRSDF